MKDIPLLESCRRDAFVKALMAFSRCTCRGIILIDLVRETFSFVSGSFDFLCGCSAKDVAESGYSFYERCVVWEDLGLVRGLGEACLGLLQHFPLEERTDFSLHCDFRVQNPSNGKSHLIHHIFTTLDVDEFGRPCLVLCAMSKSSAHTSGYVRMKKSSESAYYEYDIRNRLWTRRSCVALKEMERKIIFLASQGLTVPDIASELCKSKDAIKTCKQKLFKRLRVRNMVEAITYAYNYQLL